VNDRKKIDRESRDGKRTAHARRQSIDRRKARKVKYSNRGAGRNAAMRKDR